MEKFRAFGSSCECHQAERRAGKVVHCDKTSRRLREAREWVAGFTAEFQAWVNGLTQEHCRGIHAVLVDLQYCCRFVLAELPTRTSWLGELLYLYVNVTLPAVARLIVEKMAADPMHQQHRVTFRNWSLWERDIRAIAASDPQHVVPE